MSLTRGQFLGAAVAAVAFRNETVRMLESIAWQTDKDPELAARDESYWAGIRRAFDVENTFLFLNHGGACPSPNTVQDAMEKRIRTANRAPSYYLFRKQDHEVDKVRGRIAKLFGCSPEEIAVTPNASHGLFTGIMGVRATAGDLMVATSQEYPRVLTALHQRERRDGIRIIQAEIPASPKSPADIAAPFTRLAASKPKLIVFPRIGFLDGGFFPAEQICRSARQQGALTLIDGAHSIGQVEDTAASLGCDMFACCLHKWILGPIGTGFFFVKKELIPAIWPLEPADADLDSNIRKFEQFGTHPTGISLAITEALDAHEAIGTARKSARIAYLRHYWTSKLIDEPKIRFHSNLDPNLSRCLTTVEVLGCDTAALASWLFTKHQIFVTTAIRDQIRGIRVSPQIFQTPAELDRLVAALRIAATKGIQ